MPIGDGRTIAFPPRGPRTKKRLGHRDAPVVDTDTLLNELRAEAVSVVAQVLSVGGAVFFGCTRNRSAMLVRAWVGDEPYEDYVTSVGELMATFEALSDACEAAARRSPTA